MVQILAVLMILGLIGMFVQGRRKGKADQLAMALMLLCIFTFAIHPVNADDGGAVENGGENIKIRRLRDTDIMTSTIQLYLDSGIKMGQLDFNFTTEIVASTRS